MTRKSSPTKRAFVGLRHLLFSVPFAAMLLSAAGCSTAASIALGAASPQTADLTAQMEAMNRIVTLMTLQGYVSGYAALGPGEYARYRVPGGFFEGSRAGVVEVANLGKDQGEGLWWRVKFIEAQTLEKSTLEFALSSAGEPIMMRRKLPNDREVVVQKLDRNERWMRNVKVDPTKATAGDSVQIIDKGIEDVAVPAGTFRAKHVVYQGNWGSTELWSADAVAGKSVKIKNAIAARDGRPRRETLIELETFGTGATSETGMVLPR